jgi:23S rRNA pseudouridine1911/1915/1917 synthase
MKPTETKIFTVSRSFGDKTIAAFLRNVLTDITWSEVKKLLAARQVTINDRTETSEAYRLSGGERVIVGQPEVKNSPAEGKKTPDVKIVYLDDHVVVVEKPAGLTTIRHPHELREYHSSKVPFLPDTLIQVLPKLIVREEKKRVRKGTPPPLKAVHRLDKDTSGLLVMARNYQAASGLGQQFKEHSINRRYIAIVLGFMPSQRIESNLVEDRGDGIRGSHAIQGVSAITNITLLEELPGYSLIECQLETGRTHQIRIHTAEAGHPVCGDKVYAREFRAKQSRDTSRAPRLTLHASVLGFHHPITGEYLEFRSELPAAMTQFLKKLRRGKNSEE